MSEDAVLLMETVKATTTAIVEKIVRGTLESYYTRERFEYHLREIVREELHNLMRETESFFVTRVADALVVRVSEKLGNKL